MTRWRGSAKVSSEAGAGFKAKERVIDRVHLQ
jgi:hypothetical protein